MPRRLWGAHHRPKIRLVGNKMLVFHGSYRGPFPFAPPPTPACLAATVPRCGPQIREIDAIANPLCACSLLESDLSGLAWALVNSQAHGKCSRSLVLPLQSLAFDQAYAVKWGSEGTLSPLPRQPKRLRRWRTLSPSVPQKIIARAQIGNIFRYCALASAFAFFLTIFPLRSLAAAGDALFFWLVGLLGMSPDVRTIAC